MDVYVEGMVGSGDVVGVGHSTYQLSTLALTRSSSPFSEIFCRISGSISTMSVR